MRALLERAGQAALDRFRRATVRLKADGTKLTDADLVVHEILLDGLSRLFPGEVVLSEEDPARPEPPISGPCWYVDPLDGTGAFTEGLAHWGPTVCRVVDGAPELGAFYVPRLDELWLGHAGAGAWRDGERLRPPDAEADASAVLLLPSHAHRVGPLNWPGRIRALGSTAAHLALVAEGGVTATVIPSFSPWDVGCGVLLIREAGRVLVDLSGAPLDPMMLPNRPFLAAAPGAVPALLDAIRRNLQPRI